MRIFKRIMSILFYVCVLFVLCVTAFVNQKSFGKLPSGNRLELIKQSPNYKDGQFQNELPTTVMTGKSGSFKATWKFLTDKPENTEPPSPIPSVKTDLTTLPADKDFIVWFGHFFCLL